MLAEAFNAAAQRSTWVEWLIASDSAAAVDTRAFLQTAFSHIRAEKQRSVADRIQKGDASQIEATIHELVAHELFRRLQLRPVFEPLLEGKTPDLSFETAGMKCIADIVVCHSPSKTVRDLGNGIREAWDRAESSESRAEKIAKVLQKKADSYAGLGLPIVPIIFLGDRNAFGFRDIEKACFGVTLREVALEPRFPESLPKYRVPVGGLLLPRDDFPVPCENMSAVIACDWFDTLNRQRPGKRLASCVLHRWSARQILPGEAFAPLPQVCWDPIPSGGWLPRWATQPNLVLQFLDSDQIQVRPYSLNTAW
jgi:hypothetical protein